MSVQFECLLTLSDCGISSCLPHFRLEKLAGQSGAQVIFPILFSHKRILPLSTFRSSGTGSRMEVAPSKPFISPPTLWCVFSSLPVSDETQFRMVTMQYPTSSYPPALSTLFPSTFLPTFLSTLFPSSFLPACGLSILHTLQSESHLTLPYISSLLQ